MAACGFIKDEKVQTGTRFMPFFSLIIVPVSGALHLGTQISPSAALQISKKSEYVPALLLGM